MKKLIALAVAAASMPAMAAVSVSGSYNVEYVDDSSTKEVQSYDVDVAVSASAEMDNGMTISASLEADDTDDDGSVTISGAFGSIAMGDVAGALDAVDGEAIGTARDAQSAGAGTDASVTYTLPTFVEGLTVKASMNAEDGGNGVENDDASSVAASYSMSGVKFHLGTESRDAADVTGYGISYSAAGFTVGYGYSEVDADAANADVETSALAAGYTVGNLTLAVNTKEVENEAGATTADVTSMSVAYSMGGGVTAYASTTEDDETANSETTRFGIKFAF